MTLIDILDLHGPILGAFIYLFLLFIALNFQFYITYKLKISGTQTRAVKNFRIIYFGVTIALLAYALADNVSVFTDGVYKINYTFFGIALAYTLVILGLNSFLLKTINFRKGVRKIVKTLAIIESILMVSLVIALLPAMFIDSLNLMAELAISVIGLIMILTLVFTVATLIVESIQAVNKMIKLRLSMAAIGTLGILLDGLANVLYIAVPSLGTNLYVSGIVPILAILFFSMMLFGYYFSLFPPVWLQRVTNVLPPSFADLMKKRTVLEETMAVSK
jgi:hypothetical protein